MTAFHEVRINPKVTSENTPRGYVNTSSLTITIKKVILQYINAMRIRIILPFLSVTHIIYLWNLQLDRPIYSNFIDLIQIYTITILVLSITYISNKLTDICEDTLLNRKLDEIFYRSGKYCVLLLFSILTAIAIYNTLLLLLSMFLATGGIMYSVKPFRFKSRPPLDLLIHVILIGLGTVALPHIIIKNDVIFDYREVVLMIGMGLSGGAIYLISAYEDIHIDVLCGVKTSAVILGRKTVAVSGILLLTGVVTISLSLPILAIGYIISAFLYLIARITKTIKKEHIFDLLFLSPLVYFALYNAVAGSISHFILSLPLTLFYIAYLITH